MEGLQLERTVFKEFVKSIEKDYGDNSYHNSRHAADVLQFTHYFVKNFITDEIDAKDTFCLYFSAIIHDHSHPGVTNQFLIATNDSLVEKYGMIGTLEHHHIATSFDKLKTYSFITKNSAFGYSDLMSCATELVLATDLGQQASIIAEFKSATSVHKSVLKKMILKLADLSSSARKPVIHQKWSEAIWNELFLMGDKERELRLPISPGADRTLSRIENNKKQVGFMNFVVRPVYEAMNERFPTGNWLAQLDENMKLYPTE